MPSCKYSPSFILPQELIDRVIDCVQEDDPLDLQSLGLVSSAWYRRTRYHLFREVELSDGDAQGRCGQLNSLVQSNSVLAKCIKMLYVGAQLKMHEEGEDPWFLSCPKLVDTIALLAYLEHVVLVDIDWDLLSPALNAAFYNLMASPNIGILHLSAIDNMDPSLLVQFHHIKSLTIEDVEVSPPHSVLTGSCFPLNLPSPTPIADQLLRFLTVTKCGEFLKTLMKCLKSSEATLNISQITELTVWAYTFDEDMIEAWPMLLNLCGLTVKTFSVKQTPPSLQDDTESGMYWILPDSIFPFNHLPNLEHIHLHLSYYCLSVDDFRNFMTLACAFDRLSQSDTPSNLTTVNFSIDFNKWNDDIEAEEEGLDVESYLDALSTGKTWVALGDILKRPSFPKLQVFNITFNTSFCAVVPAERRQFAVANIHSQMNGLMKKGVMIGP
ncbi:hypothetical protein EST38_g5385 [Candolleomyces aberdarensis]|uniref:F-box domain-containing protein n=1 Tax=Candolleomyces aberdarensis TaxID=2316362 RepID=A0A4Q2DK78_9AGAR|nr:hypothetical protein EST38_g5385 [Candolleomyces aberdarensis]